MLVLDVTLNTAQSSNDASKVFPFKPQYDVKQQLAVLAIPSDRTRPHGRVMYLKNDLMFKEPPAQVEKMQLYNSCQAPASSHNTSKRKCLSLKPRNLTNDSYPFPAEVTAAKSQRVRIYSKSTTGPHVFKDDSRKMIFQFWPQMIT